MALQFEAKHLCKLFYTENGRAFIRRIGTIIVQRADGHVMRLSGDALPDTISLHVHGQSEAGSVLEMIQCDPPTSATPIQSVQPAWPILMVPTRPRFFTMRDGFILLVGMLLMAFLVILGFAAWAEVGSLLPTPRHSAYYQ